MTAQPIAGTLFSLPTDDIAITSDDCYTPRWVFDAMGITFDLDPCAPVGGPWHVPAWDWMTAQDDGLSQPWDGTVFCNPPYSNYTPWAHRFALHDKGIALMGLVLPTCRWLQVVYDSADAVAFVNVSFDRPGKKPLQMWQKVFVAFRGLGLEPARQLAAADGSYGSVLYGINTLEAGLAEEGGVASPRNPRRSYLP